MLLLCMMDGSVCTKELRQQTWESQVPMLVTNQCTWALSGTVGLVVSVLGLRGS